jgi:hypothetical protein
MTIDEANQRLIEAMNTWREVDADYQAGRTDLLTLKAACGAVAFARTMLREAHREAQRAARTNREREQ